MCNPEFEDGVREKVRKLIVHTGELRLKFSDVEEGHREGNLDRERLGELNQVVHLLESDAAEFERLLELS
ncbi:hypothetical protein BMS3Abin01_01169 [bacterium BMS3Abin01]|nr:hypothetical protein BMS3Abin01_01169 [bacterium BMS3Abin01]HDY69970.1 hypothetical protein [Actinomycetota bacterium]